MHWRVGDKFQLFSLSFLHKEMGVIILYKNINYKLFVNTFPFKIKLYKEVFKQSYYNKLCKQHQVVVGEWNGYNIYMLKNPSKRYLCAKRHYVPLKVRM